MGTLLYITDAEFDIIEDTANNLKLLDKEPEAEILARFVDKYNMKLLKNKGVQSETK